MPANPLTLSSASDRLQVVGESSDQIPQVAGEGRVALSSDPVVRESQVLTLTCAIASDLCDGRDWFAQFKRRPVIGEGERGL